MYHKEIQRHPWVPRQRGLVLPKPHPWYRIMDVRPGEIVGIPTCRGLAVATNDILVALEQSNGEYVFCHYEWFVKDRKEAATRSGKRASKSKMVFDSLMADFVGV